MKRSFLIFAFFAAASATAIAQNQCSKDNPYYQFDNTSNPMVVHTLGSAPEFPFLGNLSSSRQVYATIKRCERNGTHRHEIAKLNEMLEQVGFANGIKDLRPSSITMETLPSGTTGNMGSRGYKMAYTELSGHSRGYRSWKVTSGSGCYMYLLARCGNAFFPKSNETACIDVPLNITSQPQEVTVNNTPVTSTNKVFVYYHEKRRKHRANENWNANGEIPDNHPSRPLLLSTLDKSTARPETYKITVSSPDDHLKVCQDQQANVTATINVEKTSEYTGNYPSATTNNEYKQVTKRTYKKASRKMRRIAKLERKVDKRTHVHVNV